MKCCNNKNNNFFNISEYMEVVKFADYRDYPKTY